MTASAPPALDFKALAQQHPEEAAEAALRVEARQNLLIFTKVTFPTYQVDQVHRQIAFRLMKFVKQVERGEAPRLFIFCPPQIGKSELVSRRFPPWVLGNHPDWNIILASYGAELAEELSGDARRLVLDDTYQAIFGEQAELGPGETVKLEKARKAVGHWRIEGHRGGLRAVGIGGSITGRSAHILIIDDPTKGRAEADSETIQGDTWAWWPQARDRVQHGGGIIVMCTRWHWADLPGKLLQLAKEKPDADQWEVMSFKAICEEGDDDPLGRAPGEPVSPSRFTADDYRVLRASIPPRDWEAKFQQRPTNEEGNIFKREWWRYEPLDRNNLGPRRFLFWDTAFAEKRQNDYSVCGVWVVENDRYRLVDVHRTRLDFPDLKKLTVALAQTWGAWATIVEDMGSGKSLVQELKSGTNLHVIPFPVRKYGDKLQRAHDVTPMIGSQRVTLAADAPWLYPFLDEVSVFDKGTNDDQVDMMTMALLWLRQNSPLQGLGRVYTGPPKFHTFSYVGLAATRGDTHAA